MLDEKQREHLAGISTVLQIIVLALVFGVVTFAFVVFFVLVEDGGKAEQGIISIIAACTTLVAIVAAEVVPRIIRSNMRQAIVKGKPLGTSSGEAISNDMGDVGSLAAVFQTTTIVGAAILEGAAFFNLVAYMLEHQTINLMCAALLVVAILFKRPNRSKLEGWVEDELKSIEELRAFEG